MEVTCRCGWTTRGSKSEVIASIQAHGRSEHQQEITPAQVRAIWRTVANGTKAGHRNGGEKRTEPAYRERQDGRAGGDGWAADLLRPPGAGLPRPDPPGPSGGLARRPPVLA